MYVGACCQRWRENYSFYFHQIRNKRMNYAITDAIRPYHTTVRRIR